MPSLPDKRPGSAATVGILMLDTRFPRIPGDIGNRGTWAFPVMMRPVPGATVERVVNDRARGLIDDFVDAGLQLVAEGADGITTSCGFMSLWQRELARRLPVPVATSSLLQVPLVDRLLGGDRRAGVITANRASLSEDHLVAAGAAADTPVVGLEGSGEFARAILGDTDSLNPAVVAREVVGAAGKLVAGCPDVGAIVLECTNLGPYAADIRTATGLPVFSIVDFVCWFQAGLRPRSW